MMKSKLAQIRHAFFAEPISSGSAVALVEKATKDKSDKKLSHLLRHHDEETIKHKETWDRDSFDYLLAYYSMMEVACLSGFISGKLPESYTATAKMVLAQADVRRYYEEHYPILLPQAHLLRLQGKPIAHRMESPCPEAFETFFSLSAPIETGSGVETFLWFLDGGSRGDTNINDTIEVLSSGKQFISHMGRAADGIGPDSNLTASVHGFVEFIRFAVLFAEFLDCAGASPLIQSAMWHYHGYWFDRMSIQIGSDIRRALDSYTACFLSQDAKGEKATAKQVAGARKIQKAYQSAIARLSSGRYRYCFYEELHQR